MQYRNSSNYKGIDTASYQAGLNFALVKQQGFSIAYIKATEHTKYINPYMQQHYKEAKEQDLKIGFYHYFKPKYDAVQQAQHFINAIQGLTPDCLLALDVEETGGFNNEMLSKFVSDCLSEIAKLAGHTPVIYANTNYARNVLVANYVSSYPIWIADYNNKGVPGSNPIWETWAGYQYSSKGNIGGITVDLNEFTSDILINGGKKIMKLPVEVTGIKVIMNGQEVPNSIILNIDGQDKTYIQATSLRDICGKEVLWDGETSTVTINI